MKKILKKQVIIIIGILLLLSTVVYAQNEENIIPIIEKSELFENWENLSTEQKEKTIQPLFFNINIKDSIKRSVYNDLTVGGSLGTRYNLKDELNEIKVENQQRTGTCWAWTYTSALETTMSKKYSKTSAQYSPMHMEYLTSKMYNKTLGNGGSAMMAISYSVADRGPIYESELPFNSVYNEQTNSSNNYYLTDIQNVKLDQKAKARVTDAIIFASICKTYTTNSVTYSDSKGNSYTEEQVNKQREAIKKHIKEKGALFAYLYNDIGITAEGNYISRSGSYNPQTKAYYYEATTDTSPNHAVTIVGWDDNFSKDNFATGKKPLKDGAYIVLNSYGEQFGDNGYFYVSYDDFAIERGLAGIRDATEEDGEETYDNLYEYDELGMDYSLAFKHKETQEYLTNLYAANVFSRKDITEIEYLSEVGIFLGRTQGVEIYVNAQDDNFDNCTLVGSYTGTSALEPGYHSVKLSSPVKLTGNKFVIKVKYINSEGASLPIECNLEETGFTTGNTLYSKAKSNEGESFISINGQTWQDLYNLDLGGVIIKNTNACIKAFTTVSEIPTTIPTQGVELNQNQIKIEVGDTTNLVATVQPTNATNKSVKWTSSNNNVATVVDGKVTGISAGTTTITVTTDDGGYTDTCIVTVEEKTIAVTGVNLDKTSVSMKIGDETNLVATVQPTNATNKSIKWTSSNNNVATVINGKVTGISEGTATITVTTDEGGYKATCIVTIEKELEQEPEPEPDTTIVVTGVKLDKISVTMEVGDETNLVATVQPTNATNKGIKWTSSNNNVATVVNGKVTGISAGTATITVTTDDGGYKATCIVTIEKEPEPEPEPDTTIAVTGVKLNKTKLSIQVGDETNLVATIQPTNATNKGVKWTSSNENVATITENGIIEALNPGKTNITVTTEDGKFNAVCEITVTERTNTDDDIYIDKEEKPGKVEQVQNEDTTVAQKELPKTGVKTIIIMVISISILAIVTYIRYNNYKDIK